MDRVSEVFNASQILSCSHNSVDCTVRRTVPMHTRWFSLLIRLSVTRCGVLMTAKTRDLSFPERKAHAIKSGRSVVERISLLHLGVKLSFTGPTRL